ncbi:hypothetical protein H8S90_10730 [Olivibacter sp. SDN3]|nr:hypothetical protein [Olivibacter sp. SDN3]QNL52002.1 hypothetical protein H8S90_10730 [Olivibacter sp. SDN3]
MEGACEVEERLLYAGDGLALTEMPHLDMECLSDAAIVLVIAMDNGGGN